MRILSSAEKCRRVARRIFFTTSVAGSFSGTDFCLIFAPCEGYDEPEILPSSTHPICLMSADGGQDEAYALSSFAVDLHVTQTVNNVKGVHAMIDRSILRLA